MEIQNQREEQLEDLRRRREVFVQVSSIGFGFYSVILQINSIEKE
jgi:hypothetical protein